jgi:hypothetical protein
MMPLHRPFAAALALSVAAFAQPAAAAGARQVSAGSVEVSPRVSFTHSNLKREGYGNVDKFTQLELTPTIGFCLTDHHELTGGAILRHASTNGESDQTLGFEAGYLYNFKPQGSLIPFGGVSFGVLFYDGFMFEDTAVLAPDLTAGVRMLVGNSSSVNLTLGYQRESDNHVRMNRLVAGAGVSIFPWRTN